MHALMKSTTQIQSFKVKTKITKCLTNGKAKKLKYSQQYYQYKTIFGFGLEQRVK